jgi:hypothetical protein
MDSQMLFSDRGIIMLEIYVLILKILAVKAVRYR